MEFPDLFGPRIKLIKLSLDGLEEFFEYSKKPALYKYFEFKPQKTINESKEYLLKLLKRAETETAHYWFVWSIDRKKIIGSFGVHDIDWRKKLAEISYGISPDYQGKGYFVEALRVVLDYLFIERGFYRVCATTRFDNIPSIKGLESIGMHKEGTLRDYYLSYSGDRYDAVILSVLSYEYLKNKSIEDNS